MTAGPPALRNQGLPPKSRPAACLEKPACLEAWAARIPEPHSPPLLGPSWALGRFLRGAHIPIACHCVGRRLLPTGPRARELCSRSLVSPEPPHPGLEAWDVGPHDAEKSCRRGQAENPEAGAIVDSWGSRSSQAEDVLHWTLEGSGRPGCGPGVARAGDTAGRPPGGAPGHAGSCASSRAPERAAWCPAGGPVPPRSALWGPACAILTRQAVVTRLSSRSGSRLRRRVLWLLLLRFGGLCLLPRGGTESSPAWGVLQQGHCPRAQPEPGDLLPQDTVPFGLGRRSL